MNLLSDWIDSQSSVLERALLDWLPRRRWFRSKSKTLTSVTVEARAVMGTRVNPPLLCILKTGFADGTFERYALPLTLLDGDRAESLPEAAVVPLKTPETGGKILADACWDPDFRATFFELLNGKMEIRLGDGILRGAPAPVDLHPPKTPESKVLGAEQSNTSFIYGPDRFVKLYRRLEAGVNPEPETLHFLREHARYPHVPVFHSSLEWAPAPETPSSSFLYRPVTIAVMQEFVEARGDAWEYALASLGGGILTAEFSQWTSLLGRRVAELHNALATGRGSHSDAGSLEADFAPEPLLPDDLEDVRTSTRALLDTGFATLEKLKDTENVTTQTLIQEILAGRARLENLLKAPPRPDEEDLGGALKIRTHGDLHLGQVLVGTHNPDEIWILDFEGEPGRSLAEARRKQSPLRDAAGMLRSFHYAAHTARRARPGQADLLAHDLRAAFLKGYTGALTLPGWKPGTPGFSRLLDLFVMEKTVYELHYELNNRPDWLEIPLRGLLSLIPEQA